MPKNMTSTFPTKSQKREIRRLAAIAHERELTQAATKLLQQFHRWQKKEIDVFQLNKSIHDFHDGIARDLYKSYAMVDPYWGAVHAISNGILREDEVDAEIFKRLFHPELIKNEKA